MRKFWAWNMYFWGLFFLGIAVLSFVMRFLIITHGIIHGAAWHENFGPTLLFGPIGFVMFRIGSMRVAALKRTAHVSYPECD